MRKCAERHHEVSAHKKLDGLCEVGGADLHVPGAAAKPVDAGSLWGALTRWLLSSRTSLASFVRSYLGNKPRSCRGTASDLWPMAAPYPKLFAKNHCTIGRDLERRHQAVNLMVLTLSWLHVGKPRRCPALLSCASSLNAAQWAVVKRLEEHVDDVLHVGVVGPAEIGRGAAKVESLDELISDLECDARDVVGEGYFHRCAGAAHNSLGSSLSAGEVVGSMSGAKPVEAKAIEPDRLSLPTAPPSFDPTPLLPKLHRDVFSRPCSSSGTGRLLCG